MAVHAPVLIKEVLKYLDPKPGENFVDCTVGEGGHTALILEKNLPEGKVLGIDLDPHQISSSKWALANFENRLILANDSYANLQDIVEKNNFKPKSNFIIAQYNNPAVPGFFRRNEILVEIE